MLTVRISSADDTTDYMALARVTLPAQKGTWCILPQHVESFALLTKGTAVLTHEDGTREQVAIPGGECHVMHDTITITL